MISSEPIIWVLIGISFTIYFLISFIYKKIGVHNLEDALNMPNGLRLLNLKYLLGIVLFGFLFYVLTPKMTYIIGTFKIPRLSVLISILVALLLSGYLSYRATLKYQIQNNLSNNYKSSDRWTYFGIRFTFLLFYELFFRGILLFTFLEFNTAYLAIFYCTILYVLIHIFDSKKEIIGAIPFGIILCLFTYITESIWYAFFIHLTLSAVYEISIFYRQKLTYIKS